MLAPIRVLHVADKFGVGGSSVHGVSRLFSWWFPAFDSSRFLVELVGLRPPDNSSKHLNDLGIKIQSLNKSKYDLTTYHSLLRVVKNKRPQILHLHGYGAMNFGGLVGARLNIPFIVHEHFVDQRYPLVQRPFDWFLAPRASLAIAVSHSVEAFMYRRGFSARRLKLIYNGVPLQTFRPADEESVRQERQRLGIPAGAVVLGTVGRLDEIKGNQYAIQAFAELISRGFGELWLLVVGDGPCSDALRAQARASGVADRVVFSGFRADVPLLQSVMDIQMFPSLSEGSPLTMFEAMSMGKAIVATNVGGLGEILNHDETAILVEPADGVQLANGVERLLKDPALADKLSQSARRDAQRHDISHVVDILQELYTERAARNEQSLR